MRHDVFYVHFGVGCVPPSNVGYVQADNSFRTEFISVRNEAKGPKMTGQTSTEYE